MFQITPGHEEIDYMAAHLQHLGWADLASLLDEDDDTADGAKQEEPTVVVTQEAIFDTEGLFLP